jgi:hypothetical protein
MYRHARQNAVLAIVFFLGPRLPQHPVHSGRGDVFRRRLVATNAGGQHRSAASASEQLWGRRISCHGDVDARGSRRGDDDDDDARGVRRHHDDDDHRPDL